MLIVTLLLLLGHPNYAMRQAAHDGLVELAEPADLLPLLDHPDPEVRWRADLLIMQTGWKELRRLLASLQSVPFIDADPDWQRHGLQIYLSKALSQCHERGVRTGAPDYPEYKLATCYALHDGRLTDPWRLAWMMERTAVYMENPGRWMRPAP